MANSQSPAIQHESIILNYTDSLQHKGTMSTKPAFEKTAKVVCPTMWTYDICALEASTYYDYY